MLNTLALRLAVGTIAMLLVSPYIYKAIEGLNAAAAVLNNLPK